MENGDGVEGWQGSMWAPYPIGSACDVAMADGRVGSGQCVWCADWRNSKQIHLLVAMASPKSGQCSVSNIGVQVGGQVNGMVEERMVLHS